MNDSPSLYVPTGPGVPGTTGTPTFIASEIEHQEGANEYTEKEKYLPKVLALVLSPSPSMTSGDGPTKAIPACSTFLANSAFSDKKP
jgi:hypothetical protein